MSERRSFLKAATLLPLTVLSAAAVSSESSAEELSTQDVAQSLSDGTTPSQAHPAPQPPISEQPFPDYHLLGRPDPSTNLLGNLRPKDWKTTKADLKDSLLHAAKQDDPIHEWLKTFEVGFDVHASRVVLEAAKNVYRPGHQPELKYEPQLYDVSLRSASALLDRCLRYRNEMGSYEIAGVNAGIGYLTFIRMKPLQRNFLIQSNAADLAKIEQTTETIVGDRYRQVGGINKIFEKRQLQAKEAEADGNAEEAARSEAKNNFLSAIIQKQFHLQIDAQLALLTRLLSPGSSSNYAERYLRLLAMLAEDLADAYCKVFSVSQGIQQVLGLVQVTVGAGSPVATDIPIFATINGVQAWITSVVPTDGGAQRQPDILDALVLWTRAVIRELDTRSQYETEFTVSIPLNQPSGSGTAPILTAADIASAFQSSTPTGKVTFTLPASSLPLATAISNIRVVGVGLSLDILRDGTLPIQYTSGFPGLAVPNYEIPKMARLNATLTSPQQKLKSGTSYSRPTIFVPNVRIQGGAGGDLEPLLCYDPGCRGLYPFGSWTIAFDPNAIEYFLSAAAISDSFVQGLILHFRLRGTLA